MIVFWLLLAAAVAMTAAQDAFPGSQLFHAGWYNVADAALVVIAAYTLRGKKTTGERIALGGAAIIVFAGVASGLLAADTHTVVGSPGATVSDDEIGAAFVFPLAPPGADWRAVTVAFQKNGKRIAIGPARRYTGSVIASQFPRTAVWVSAADSAGNSLTITQPTNGTFLSPVLAMQQSTTIAGMAVRYDTFAVPELMRTVKAVLFDPDQAARLGTQAPPGGGSAMLFAVADRSGRPVRNGIGIVPSGEQRSIGGLRLRAIVGRYPAVRVASGPYLPVAIAGGIVLFAGALRTAYRSKM